MNSEAGVGRPTALPALTSARFFLALAEGVASSPRPCWWLSFLGIDKVRLL